MVCGLTNHRYAEFQSTHHYFLKLSETFNTALSCDSTTTHTILSSYFAGSVLVTTGKVWLLAGIELILQCNRLPIFRGRAVDTIASVTFIHSNV